MKYEYGKEYETNGKKPDLPDDVEIRYYMPNAGRWSISTSTVGRVRWTKTGLGGDISKFRIVDDRFKPMKYEYGKEYTTNGKKPDLPDDVLVDIYEGDVWIKSDGHVTIKEWSWSWVEKFRIVDERYKHPNMVYGEGSVETPKGVIVSKPNDWHERGDDSLTHGEKCEVYNGKEWLPAKFIANDPDGFGPIFKTKEGYIVYVKSRPLRTERDVLIKKMCNDTKSAQDKYNVNIDCSVAMRGVMDDLIDAGWRPIKQQTEDEFVDYAIKRFVGAIFTSQWAELYRAGCRFVEQGK